MTSPCIESPYSDDKIYNILFSWTLLGRRTMKQLLDFTNFSGKDILSSQHSLGRYYLFNCKVSEFFFNILLQLTGMTTVELEMWVITISSYPCTLPGRYKEEMMVNIGKS